MESGLGLGEQAAEHGLDTSAGALESTAEKLRRWHKKSVPMANKAKIAKYVGNALNLFGAAKAGVEGGNNFANCERGK